ncbi:MAG: hypothetical protein SFV81_30125 [Pirellulaceae bacterium]|nr:hypothetical protein [Pirellulaceae bacterium]
MPATKHEVERLSLTFKVQDPPASRSVLPGGWWLWCLLGIGVGFGGWLLSREYLAKRLGQQLSEAKSRPEAMVALEGLLLLDSTASHAIVAGLQNEDFTVARTAFRAIESQIERWQKFSPAEAKARMEALAQSLQQLPDTTPQENLILASSLASRMFTVCLEREDPSLSSTMQLCEQVIARAGKGRLDLASDERVASLPATNFTLSDSASEVTTEYSEPENSSGETTTGLSDPLSMPPPPLPPDVDPNLSNSGNTNLGDKNSIGRAPELLDRSDNSALPLNTSDALSSTGGRASLRLVASPVRSSQPKTVAENDAQVRSPMVLTPADIAATEPVASPTNEEPNAKTLAGIDQLPIQDLVRLLASVQPKIAQAAALALRRHGMSDSKLELAMELATGSEARRLEIIGQFPNRTDLDPRVWLLWMAQDGQTEVRRRSIAQLSLMLDQDVMRELRLLLNREREPEIAQQIRKILVAPN